MEHLLQFLQPYLHRYGYLTIIAAVFLEDFGIPVPGETLLIAGSLLATQGEFNIYILMACAWAGAVLGDNVGFLIGRVGGRRLALRFGRYVLITPDRLRFAENFFRRRGAIVVIGARFIEILRQLNGIIAGTANLEWWRFLIYNGIGAALWVGLWSTVAYRLGSQGQQVVALFKKYEPFAIGAMVLLGAAVVVVRIVRSKREKSREAEQRDETSGNQSTSNE